jgi:fructokinase
MMTRPKIIALGEVLWDIFPDGARFGGAPANFASHIALLGGSVTMASAVGDDERGHKAISILRSVGVDTGLVQILPGSQSGSVSVELDSAGKPTFTIHENSAWDSLAWSPELAQRIEEVNSIYFGTLGQRSSLSRATIRRAAQHAAAYGIPRILDVNLRRPFFDDAMIRDSIALASILKLSDEELSAVVSASGLSISRDATPETILRALLKHFGLDLVVMTRGAQGALLVTPTGTFDQPGIPVEVVSTVGAGDSFTAAFLLGVLHNRPFDEILRSACTRASEVCTIAGAVPTEGFSETAN